MENKNVRVLFKNDDFLVIEKPAGMVVNKAQTQHALTIQEWLEEGENKDILLTLQGSGDVLDQEFVSRGGVVHRLDKETSGLLIIAKNPKSFLHLKNQFKEGKVQKTYIALVHGRLAPLEGMVDVPIGRLPWNRMRFGVLVGGREAVTHYKVDAYYSYGRGRDASPLTLLNVFPKTGRTHQIRVHMQHLGFPLFSDELYAGRKQAKADRKILPRHFLHAATLSIIPPNETNEVTYQSDLPEDLLGFLNILEKQKD